MSVVKLREHQKEALTKMKNGCILNGGTGSGKSLTSIAYYYMINNGEILSDVLKRMVDPCDLYIITTARKRDTKEWDDELSKFELSTISEKNTYDNIVVVDSWNNIAKYIEVQRAFFIFDEQRVVGYGKWTTSFLKITAHNKWILLSATPGDVWMDYVPVFVANHFYKNKTDFVYKHVIYSAFTSYPKVDRYVNEGKLCRLRDELLVDMKFARNTIQHHIDVICDYDISDYKYIRQNRWNIYKNSPISNASEYCMCLRQCVNSSVDRQNKLLDILKKHDKVILFYSYDYELDILTKLFDSVGITYAQWNGHKHQPIPVCDKWVYIVEYIAGCEGWNCILTDTVVFFSQSYSYRSMIQAAGRIDRLNTPFTDLYYYHLKSNSSIDISVAKALKRKKNFNERGFAPIFK